MIQGSRGFSSVCSSYSTSSSLAWTSLDLSLLVGWRDWCALPFAWVLSGLVFLFFTVSVSLDFFSFIRLAYSSGEICIWISFMFKGLNLSSFWGRCVEGWSWLAGIARWFDVECWFGSPRMSSILKDRLVLGIGLPWPMLATLFDTLISWLCPITEIVLASFGESGNWLFLCVNCILLMPLPSIGTLWFLEFIPSYSKSLCPESLSPFNPRVSYMILLCCAYSSDSMSL